MKKHLIPILIVFGFVLIGWLIDIFFGRQINEDLGEWGPLAYALPLLILCGVFVVKAYKYSSNPPSEND